MEDNLLPKITCAGCFCLFNLSAVFQLNKIVLKANNMQETNMYITAKGLIGVS